METRSMSTRQLVLRCYAEKKQEHWQAFCLEFDLAVQAESFQEAKSKLEAQIVDYVTDALVGEDKEYADQLLSRRAPLRHWAKWYWYCASSNFFNMKNGVHKLFKEPMPLIPAAS
jgi:hypothetical protein